MRNVIQIVQAKTTDLEKTVLQKGQKWAATLYGMYNATVYGVWYSYTTAQANPDPD